jgi:hypothetical protein
MNLPIDVIPSGTHTNIFYASDSWRVSYGKCQHPQDLSSVRRDALQLG